MNIVTSSLFLYSLYFLASTLCIWKNHHVTAFLFPNFPWTWLTLSESECQVTSSLQFDISFGMCQLLSRISPIRHYCRLLFTFSVCLIVPKEKKTTAKIEHWRPHNSAHNVASARPFIEESNFWCTWLIVHLPRKKRDGKCRFSFHEQSTGNRKTRCIYIYLIFF